MAYESIQPRNYDPGLSNVPATQRVWALTGSTDTITDASIHPSSQVNIEPTSAPNGTFWSVVSQGSCVVHSTSSETAGLTYTYRIL